MSVSDSEQYSDFFAQLDGGQAVIDWFGFAPLFHDATLTQISFADRSAELQLRAFRMTSEVDDNGYFKTDRHASVTIRLSGVMGVALTGNAATSIISNLRFRQLAAEDVPTLSCDGPEGGNIEVAIESSYGLEGVLYARSMTMNVIAA
jgi:hypothetical protein